MSQPEFPYMILGRAEFADDWQKTIERALRSTTPKQRAAMTRLIGGEPKTTQLVVFVSPSVRLECAAWRTYCWMPFFEHPDVDEDEALIVEVDKAEVARLKRDPVSQPTAERWERAYVIYNPSGAFDMDGVGVVHGHLFHAEVTNA